MKHQRYALDLKMKTPEERDITLFYTIERIQDLLNVFEWHFDPTDLNHVHRLARILEMQDNLEMFVERMEPK